MKSPNAKTSMTLLKVATDAVRSAWEDLKNDPEVRELKLHHDLMKLEQELFEVQKWLHSIGYERELNAIKPRVRK